MLSRATPMRSDDGSESSTFSTLGLGNANVGSNRRLRNKHIYTILLDSNDTLLYESKYTMEKPSQLPTTPIAE